MSGGAYERSSEAPHQEHQAATASTTADAVNNTGIDFEVGVPAPSATEESGTNGFVSG